MSENTEREANALAIHTALVRIETKLDLMLARMDATTRPRPAQLTPEETRHLLDRVRGLRELTTAGFDVLKAKLDAVLARDAHEAQRLRDGLKED